MAPRVLAMVMAGGEGQRLHPLTRDRAKPAVPFGGKYRLIDFVLSNFINSEIYSIYVLVQFKSQSLIEHLQLLAPGETEARERLESQLARCGFTLDAVVHHHLRRFAHIHGPGPPPRSTTPPRPGVA